MKKIVCETCGSLDLVKQDGVFVCQYCGCKYTVEEAKKLMTDGPIEVKGTVKIDNSEAIGNYMLMAATAISDGNSESAISYTDKILELDPTNSKAWDLKMQAAALGATGEDLRVQEQLTAGANAILYSKGSLTDKEKIEEDVYTFLLGSAYNYYYTATKIAGENHAQLRQAYNDAITLYGGRASDYIANQDSANLELYAELITAGNTLMDGVPDVAYGKYPEVIKKAELCMYQHDQCDNAVARRVKSYGRTLTGGNSRQARTIIQAKIDKGNKYYNECRAQELEKRKREYWEAHAEEKQTLERESKTLEKERKDNSTEISRITKKIDEIRSEIHDDYSEHDSIQRQIEELAKQKSALSFFNRKDRKAIQLQIEEWTAKKNNEMDRIQQSHKRQEDELAPRIESEEARITELEKRNSIIDARLQEIQNEFSKER